MSRLDTAIDDIRRRFGKDAIRNACLYQDIKISREKVELTMPTGLAHIGG